ncbi:nuclear transport factor 2 family protein [Blastopirellula sp. J2-11]|uniref:YybH family protein n=1 Tax=Blastopirellula sp. J2-11 TaxID=2943192 RepID=UPI0021C6C337|nr:nuclear transport factor 2 family protein [Blastopirellula sp. J2-11]UUO05124.1 nuclear transport factor 2 family protein [Blastopirellula sp. J2-11]
MTTTARSLIALLLFTAPACAQVTAPSAAQPAKPKVVEAKPEKPPEKATTEEAETEQAAPPSEAETAIAAAIQSYVIAFNKGDAEALAAHWTPEGEFATPAGDILQGRKALQEDFAAYFSANQEAKIELLETQITLVSPSVASEVGVARVIVPDQEPSDTMYEAVHVKTTEGWKIDRVSEQAPPPLPPSNYAHLQELEWLVGRWIDADETSSIESNVQWTKNRNFITQSFKVSIGDRVDFEGTQIIGWDPYAQTIRSWTFDSDGGFGAGRWTNQGNRWTVQSLNVLPDGRRGSSTSIYEIVDENSLQFQSVGRQVDGELMPSIEPTTVVRVSVE